MATASENHWDGLMRYVDGLLCAEEVHQLEARLASDAQLRRDYLLMLELHSELAWTNRAIASNAAAQQPPVDVPDSVECERRSIGHYWQSAVGAISHPMPLSLIVAGLFTTSIVLSLALWTVPMLKILPEPTAPFSIVAEIVRTHEARWENADLLGTESVGLKVDEELVLTSGLAEIRFDSGAVVLLRGPARLVPREENRCELLDGELTAKVPSAAVGFTVDTSPASFVDLGTEFGVGVDGQDSADLHVFEGVVEVRPRSNGNGSESAARQVRGGESVRVESNGEVGSASSSIVSSRFLRVSPSQPLDPRNTETVVFQQGRPDPFTKESYQGCEDVMLIAWGSDGNFGGRPDFDVGNFNEQRSGRTLIRFDLSSMKGKFQAIRSVTLRLTTSNQDYSPAGRGEIQVLRLSNANAAWQEGDKATGSDEIQQQPGDSTWNHLHWPDSPWAGSHGAGKVGIDFLPVIYGAKPYSEEQPAHETIDLRLSRDLSFVESWANGETNAGLLLKNGVENAPSRINFYSSEHDELEFRPQLIVEYVPVK